MRSSKLKVQSSKQAPKLQASKWLACNSSLVCLPTPLRTAALQAAALGCGEGRAEFAQAARASKPLRPEWAWSGNGPRLCEPQRLEINRRVAIFQLPDG